MIGYIKGLNLNSNLSKKTNVAEQMFSFCKPCNVTLYKDTYHWLKHGYELALYLSVHYDDKNIDSKYNQLRFQLVSSFPGYEHKGIDSPDSQHSMYVFGWPNNYPYSNLLNV